MRRFADLYDALDMTTSTNAKVAHLVDYFADAPPSDAAWVVYFLMGRRFKRPVTTTQMRAWTYELANVPEWLFDESYYSVGDLAEAISLTLDAAGLLRESDAEAADESDGESDRQDLPLAEWVERLQSLRDRDEDDQKAAVTEWWTSLDMRGVFLLNKLLMGSMRVGVSSGLVTRALAKFTGHDKATISHRLMGQWEPSAEFFAGLMAEDTADADRSRPYPYFLASPLEQAPQELGAPQDWLVEWKWDGIRGQLIKRDHQVFLWSRGQELVTSRYPELEEAAQFLPDGVVIDGEIMAWEDDGPLPFSMLQKRIGRKRVTAKLREEVPVAFVGYDLMEFEHEDVRKRPLQERRALLESFFEKTHERFRLSKIVEASDWDAYAELRETARERKVEGFMLKRRDSPYRTGRKRGDWWKWKVDPYTIDAVLMYAQAGHGRRASLYTDYTFGVWTDEGTLVPIAKAYSGLSDKEIRSLDSWVRSNTLERFGPVRSVETAHVFEIAFAGLRPSNRHKSGIAVRFPRIVRWRHDKSPGAANTLADVEELLEFHHG